MSSFSSQNIVQDGDWKPAFDPTFSDDQGNTYNVSDVSFNANTQRFSVVGAAGQPIDITTNLNFAQKRQFNGFDMNAALLDSEKNRPGAPTGPLKDESFVDALYNNFQIVPPGGTFDKILQAVRWLVYMGLAAAVLYVTFEGINAYKKK